MLLRRLYYTAKPYLPYGLRLSLRRLIARARMPFVQDIWPINPAAAIKPDGWSGWPDGKQFAFVLTHDVEGRCGLENVRRLAELEMRLGFRSCFNFIPEGQYRVPKELRDWLTDHGFEVGVHDLHHDGKLFSSRRNFQQAVPAINRYLKEWGSVGFRSGFMLRNLDWLRDLQVAHDSSTFDVDPFEPQPEGVNTVFPFEIKRDDGSSFVELPYTLAQDSTLYLLRQPGSTDIWNRKRNWIAAHGGMALVNVHPDYLAFSGQKLPLQALSAEQYESFLINHADRWMHQSWHALPREVAQWLNTKKADTYSHAASSPVSGSATEHRWRLRGKRAAVALFSYYPADPRPRRAAEALVREGVHVDLICLQESGEAAEATFNGVRIKRLPIKRRRAGKLAYAWQYGTFIGATFTILGWRSLTRRYDLVHVHNMPDILVLSSLIPKILGARVVLDLHDPMPELMQAIFGLAPTSKFVVLLRLLERFSIRLADVVLTPNEAFRKLFASRSCPADKVAVVMNSPDEAIFPLRPPSAPNSRPPRDDGRCIVMYHGSLVERHGLDLAVNAIALLQATIPRIELRIYGHPTPFSERVLSSAAARGLADRVRYFGGKSLEEISRALEECDLGVIPNHRSTFTELNMPTRIFEYLSHGKPVIAPRTPAIQDYFREEDIFFFTLGDGEDLAAKIALTQQHPEETLARVKRGQEVYRQHLWQKEKSAFIGRILRLLEHAT